MEEVLEDKRREFQSLYKKLANSPIREMMELGALNKPDEIYPSIEESLRHDQSIPFCLGKNKDTSAAFDEACRLAINHEPPFDKDSDKGFKDFVIGWTVREKLSELKPGDQIIALTKDNRLKTYFEKTLGIKVATTEGDFMRLAQPLTVSSRIQDGVTTQEALPPQKGEGRAGSDRIASLIGDFESSSSFSTTRSMLPALKQASNCFTKDDKVALLRIALKNTQVKWLLHDADLEGLFLPMFEECGDKLDVREADELVATFRLQPLIDMCASIDMSATGTYRSFLRELDNCIISVDPDARVESLSSRVLPKLNMALLDNKLDRRVPACSEIIETFIEMDMFDCMSWDFDYDVLESFVEMMDHSGWRQRFVTFRNVASSINARKS